MVKNYLPKKGDLVWMSFDPSLGHEQKGRRPALVVSSGDFNKATGMVYVCPVTTTDKKYLHHLPIDSYKVEGFVMCEHLRSIDYVSRKLEFIEKASATLVVNVSNCLEAILC